jgi:ankyrin repeat protein/serine/threonine protein kinase
MSGRGSPAPRFPLHSAASNPDFTELDATQFCAAKEDLDHRGRTPIFYAAENTNENAMLRLIAAGADVNKADGGGITPALEAACNENGKVIYALIAAGADVNKADKDGRTPALMAAGDYHTEHTEKVLCALIAAGADVNKADKDGRTPALMAAGNYRTEHTEKVLCALIAAGADVNKADKDGWTPALAAARIKNAKMIGALIAAGADVNQADKDGRTPALMAACTKNEKPTAEVFWYLIAAGADLNKADNHGNTPAMAATRNKIRELSSAELDALMMAAIHSPARAEAALAGARLTRSRFASLGCATTVLARGGGESSGPFATFDRLVPLCEALSQAETALGALQATIRGATTLDIGVIGERDRARQRLADAATALIAERDRDSSESVAGACALVASVRASLKLWTAAPAADLVAGDEAEFGAWFAANQATAANCAILTELAATALQAALAAYSTSAVLPGGGVSVARDLPARFLGAVLAGESESATLNAIKLPAALFERVTAQLDVKMAECTLVADALERARFLRVPLPPSEERIMTAHKAVKSKLRVLLKAKTDAEHADDDDDDVAALQAAAREAKRDWSAALSESNAAVVELAAHLADFPELHLRYPHAQFDVLLEGGAVCRALEEFENRETLAHARHRVEMAQLNGEPCALKLFDVGTKQQRAFLKEARRLRQLAHPHVVELRAVFVDVGAAKGVLQMPLYAHRDLWHWLEAAPRTVHDKLALLRQALSALEHVHRMGVVHADVKPENVFVSGDGSAKLGDFDVSHDDTTRLTMVTTLVGFTPHYAAPELLRGAAASKASDLFAFGATLHDIVLGDRRLQRPCVVDALAAHEPVDGERALRELAGALLHDAAERRPTASVALTMAPIAVPAPGRDASRDRRVCGLCEEVFWADEGAECGAATTHFVCCGDLARLVTSFCGLSLAEVARRGSLCCKARSCGAAWSVSLLAARVPDNVFAQYVEVLQRVQESRVLQEQQVQHRAELAEQERRLRGEMARDEEIAMHRRHIEEQILNLRCPRCEAVFHEFDNCFALTCGKCRAGFCAWCLHDCGDDAHQHVANCVYNRARPSVFGSLAQFDACHVERRERLVAEYVRERVREELRETVKIKV